VADTINWQSVAYATLHPTQVQVLEQVAARGRLSPVQFEGREGSISRVAYHFRALRNADLLEPGGTAPRRGATEHFYRLGPAARA
jgi:hypothetical protein